MILTPQWAIWCRDREQVEEGEIGYHLAWTSGRADWPNVRRKRVRPRPGWIQRRGGDPKDERGGMKSFSASACIPSTTRGWRGSRTNAGPRSWAREALRNSRTLEIGQEDDGNVLSHADVMDDIHNLGRDRSHPCRNAHELAIKALFPIPRPTLSPSFSSSPHGTHDFPHAH